MKLFNKHSIVAFGLILAVSATPSTALAKGDVHLGSPGISINVGHHHGSSFKRHNRKFRHSRNRGYSKGYRQGRRDFKRKQRKNNYYNNNYRDYRYNNYGNKKRYNKKRYNKKRYNDSYYYNGNSNNSRERYYDRSRSSQHCAVAGYSQYIDNDRSCYEHKDHFHCE